MPSNAVSSMASEDPGSLPLAIEIRRLHPGEDATAFRTLNEEWITRHFTLEAKDIETLSDPENSILGKGGHIFLAFAGGKPVGCVALMPMENGVYELSKMAVSPHLRGQGVGRRLLECAIAQARLIGAKSLFLAAAPSSLTQFTSMNRSASDMCRPRLCRPCRTRGQMYLWRWNSDIGPASQALPPPARSH